MGPSVDSEEVFRKLILAGMNVARFNFSHADPVVDKRRFDMLVKVRNELGLPVASMLDTKGPEIRLGKFKDNKPVTINDGDEFTLTANDIEGTSEIASVTFKGLPADVSEGTKILINDGAVELEVISSGSTDIKCRVIHGGVLSNHKGVNVPGVALSLPYISEAERKDNRQNRKP